MKVDLPVTYSQYDLRWSDLLLGYNIDYQYNFYNYACLLCDLTSALRYFGKNIDPIELNELLKGLPNYTGFQMGTGNYVWGAVTRLFPDIQEKVVNVPDPTPLTQDHINEIRTALDNRYPVVVLLDYNPKTVKPDFHYVTLIDYDPNDENNFTVADPLGGKPHSLKDYLGWFRPNARQTIQQYIIYTGPRPLQELGTVQVPIQINEDNVHGSSQWDKVCEYLIAGDPKHLYFEPNNKDTLDGYKRDRDNFAITAARIPILIAEKQQAQMTLEEEQITHQKEIEVLKQNMITVAPDFEALRKEYDRRIEAVSDTNKKLLQRVTDGDIVNTQLKAQLSGSIELPSITPDDVRGGSGLLQKLWNFLFTFSKKEYEQVTK